MKWSDLTDLIGGAAPLIGTLIAGPAGGAIGSVVAGALGVPCSPDAVKGALGSDPEANATLRKLELDHELELRKMALASGASAIESVNRTMRVEARSDRWWVSGWRPMWGFLSAVAFFVQAVSIAWLLLSGGDPKLISALASLSVFWGVPLAVCGVTAYGRSQEKIARTTGASQPTILGAIANRIAGGAAKG